MIGEGEACALWAGRVCAEGGAGTWTRRGSCRSSADGRRTTRTESTEKPTSATSRNQKKHREPLGMNFAGFAKLSLFNSINRLGPCGTPKIALGPIPDARGRTVGQKRAVNLTDPNPLRPRGPRPGSCCPQHGNRRLALAGVPALEQNSNSKLCLSTGHGPTVEIMT